MHPKTPHATEKLGTDSKAGTPEPMEKPLKSWKAIAVELGVSESWAETTGRANGLPFYQVGSAVFAYSSELHAWLRTFRSGQRTVTPPAPTLRVVNE